MIASHADGLLSRLHEQGARQLAPDQVLLGTGIKPVDIWQPAGGLGCFYVFEGLLHDSFHAKPGIDQHVHDLSHRPQAFTHWSPGPIGADPFPFLLNRPSSIVTNLSLLSHQKPPNCCRPRMGETEDQMAPGHEDPPSFSESTAKVICIAKGIGRDGEVKGRILEPAQILGGSLHEGNVQAFLP